MNVKRSFARGALEAICGARNNAPMKVRLEEIREAKGLRLEDIADKIGVAISTVQRWERQAISIPSERLPAIALAYGCRINDIFDDETRASEVELPPNMRRLLRDMPPERQEFAIKMLTELAKSA